MSRVATERRSTTRRRRRGSSKSRCGAATSSRCHLCIWPSHRLGRCCLPSQSAPISSRSESTSRRSLPAQESQREPESRREPESPRQAGSPKSSWALFARRHDRCTHLYPWQMRSCRPCRWLDPRLPPVRPALPGRRREPGQRSSLTTWPSVPRRDHCRHPCRWRWRSYRPYTWSEQSRRPHEPAASARTPAAVRP
jgi:hypothetical protein